MPDGPAMAPKLSLQQCCKSRCRAGEGEGEGRLLLGDPRPVPPPPGTISPQRRALAESPLSNPAEALAAAAQPLQVPPCKLTQILCTQALLCAMTMNGMCHLVGRHVAWILLVPSSMKDTWHVFDLAAVACVQAEHLPTQTLCCPPPNVPRSAPELGIMQRGHRPCTPQ